MKQGMKKGMKTMKTMKRGMGMKSKAMKKRSMKKRRVSNIAKGKRAKYSVFRFNKFEKTKGGLTKNDLKMNARGKIVSKKASAQGHKKYPITLKPWNSALSKARTALGLAGFVAVNGSSA